MLIRSIILTILSLSLAACSSVDRPFSGSSAPGYSISKPISCVPYARDISGIQIRGDAHTWWHQAKGRYQRSQIPREGAVFVLSKSSRLKHGHVSVVRRILGPRSITVEHSNWGNTKAKRSYIYKDMRVQDLSTNNDWTKVRFWNYHTDSWGLPYVASGFIYP